MGKILIQLGINLAVVAVFYFFGASLTTCWFTFLIFCGFAALGDLGDRLYEIEPKSELGAKLDKIERGLIVLLGEQPGALEKFLDFEKRS